MSNFFRRYQLLLYSILLDIVVSALLPVHFGYQSFIITSYIGLLGLLLTIQKFDLNKKLVVSFIYGLLIEFSLFNSSLIPLLTVMMITLLSHLLQNVFSNSMLEKGIFLFFMIAFYQFFEFFLANLFDKVNISFLSFLTYEFILSMLFNIVAIFVILLIDQFIVDRKIQNERIQKKREHISLIE